jgi:hypothetical protein
VLGDVEWLYELEVYPGDLEPVKERLGAASAVVRTDAGATAKGLGGGIMPCGDASIDIGGDVGMAGKGRPELL